MLLNFKFRILVVTICTFRKSDSVNSIFSASVNGNRSFKVILTLNIDRKQNNCRCVLFSDLQPSILLVLKQKLNLPM